MSWYTQALLYLSYAVLALGLAVAGPVVMSIPANIANMLGVVAFFAAIQVTNILRKSSADDQFARKLSALEDSVRLLRNDIERTRRSVDRYESHSNEVDSEELMSELKILHTLLDQVMRRQKEAETQQITSPAAVFAGVDTAGQEAVTKTENSDIFVLSDSMEGEGVDAVDVDGAAQVQDSSNIAEVSGARAEAGEPETAAGVAADQVPAVIEDEIFTSEAEGVTGHRPPASSKRGAPVRMIHNEKQLLDVIRSSLSDNRVDLYLQPIVSLPARKAAHFECFSRVRDEDGHVILPRLYLDIAAEKGLVGTLDNLLLFRLIQLLRRLGRRRPDTKFFCNLSRHSIADEEFFPQFIDFMATNDEFNHRLVFEIAQDDYELLDDDTLANLDNLSRRGFAFSLDQVTNLDRLDRKTLAGRGFKYIKVPTSVFDDTFHPEDLDILLGSLKKHGIEMIGSNLEREDEVISSIDSNLRLAQGYVFGEPAPASEYSKEL